MYILKVNFFLLKCQLHNMCGFYYEDDKIFFVPLTSDFFFVWRWTNGKNHGHNIFLFSDPLYTPKPVHKEHVVSWHKLKYTKLYNFISLNRMFSQELCDFISGRLKVWFQVKHDKC